MEQSNSNPNLKSDHTEKIIESLIGRLDSKVSEIKKIMSDDIAFLSDYLAKPYDSNKIDPLPALHDIDVVDEKDGLKNNSYGARIMICNSFKDDATCDCYEVIIRKIMKDVIFNADEYVVTYRWQKISHGTYTKYAHKRMNIGKKRDISKATYFFLAMTNYGSIIMASWKCEEDCGGLSINECYNLKTEAKWDKIGTKKIYMGKFKLQDVVMRIFDSFVRAILPYIPKNKSYHKDIEYEHHCSKYFSDESDVPNNECQTNTALHLDSYGGIPGIKIRFLKIYENIMNVVSEYQEKYSTIQIHITGSYTGGYTGGYAEKLINENTRLKAERDEVEKIKLEQDEIRKNITTENTRLKLERAEVEKMKLEQEQISKHIIDENTRLKEEQDEVEKMKLEQEKIRLQLNAEREELNKNLEKYKKIKDIEDRYIEIQKYKELLDTYAKNLKDDREQLEAEKLKLEKVKIERVITNIDFTKPFTEVWESKQNNSESNSETEVTEEEYEDDAEEDDEDDGINPKEIMPKTDCIKKAFSGIPLYYAVRDMVFGKSKHNSDDPHLSDQDYRDSLRWSLIDEIIETENVGLFREILALDKKSHKMSKFLNKMFEMICKKDYTGKYVKIMLRDKRIDPTGKYSVPFLEAYSECNIKAVKLLLADERFNPTECFNVHLLRCMGLICFSDRGFIIKSLISHPKFDPTANDYKEIITLLSCLDPDGNSGGDSENELTLLRLLFADNRVKINDLRKALIKKNALHLFDVLRKYVDIKDTMEIIEPDEIEQIIIKPQKINVRDIMSINDYIEKNTGLSLYYSVYNIVCNGREYKSTCTQRVNKFSRKVNKLFLSNCHNTKKERTDWLLSRLADEIVDIGNIELLQEILKIEGKSEKMLKFLRYMFQKACRDEGNIEIIKIMLNDERVDPVHEEISYFYFSKDMRSYDVEVARLLLADKRFNPASNNYKIIVDLIWDIHCEIGNNKYYEDYPDEEDNICINGKKVLKLLITDRRVKINSLKKNLGTSHGVLETFEKLINEFGIVSQ